MQLIEEQRDRVHVNLSIDSAEKQAAWIEKLIALGEFLASHSPPEQSVAIYAFEDERIGGLRIAEIDFRTEHGGGCYQRDCEGQEKFIFTAELFLGTHGIQPTRPQGWNSCLNEHGETRLKLLRTMGLDAAAETEYQLQLEEEKNIPPDDPNPDPN